MKLSRKVGILILSMLEDNPSSISDACDSIIQDTLLKNDFSYYLWSVLSCIPNMSFHSLQVFSDKCKLPSKYLVHPNFLPTHLAICEFNIKILIFMIKSLKGGKLFSEEKMQKTLVELRNNVSKQVKEFISEEYKEDSHHFPSIFELFSIGISSEYLLGYNTHKNEIIEPRRIFFNQGQDIDNSSITQIELTSKRAFAVSHLKEVYMWGHNFDLGSIFHTPKLITDTTKLASFAYVNNKISPYSQFIQEESKKPGDLEIELSIFNLSVKKICCSNNHSLLCLSNGSLFSWGNNNTFQLGYNTNDQIEFKPRRVEMLNSHEVIDICCGEGHSLAKTSEGNIYGWGSNLHGQLITNSPPSIIKHLEKIQIPEYMLDQNDEQIQSIFAEGNYSCFLSNKKRVLLSLLEKHNWIQVVSNHVKKFETIYTNMNYIVLMDLNKNLYIYPINESNDISKKFYSKNQIAQELCLKTDFLNVCTLKSKIIGISTNRTIYKIDLNGENQGLKVLFPLSFCVKNIKAISNTIILQTRTKKLDESFLINHKEKPIPKLSEICIEEMGKQLNMQNLLSWIEASSIFDCPQLEKYCLIYSVINFHALFDILSNKIIDNIPEEFISKLQKFLRIKNSKKYKSSFDDSGNLSELKNSQTTQNIENSQVSNKVQEILDFLNLINNYLINDQKIFTIISLRSVVDKDLIQIIDRFLIEYSIKLPEIFEISEFTISPIKTEQEDKNNSYFSSNQWNASTDKSKKESGKFSKNKKLKGKRSTDIKDISVYSANNSLKDSNEGLKLKHKYSNELYHNYSKEDKKIMNISDKFNKNEFENNNLKHIKAKEEEFNKFIIYSEKVEKKNILSIEKIIEDQKREKETEIYLQMIKEQEDIEKAIELSKTEYQKEQNHLISNKKNKNKIIFQKKDGI